MVCKKMLLSNVYKGGKVYMAVKLFENLFIWNNNSTQNSLDRPKLQLDSYCPSFGIK